MSNDQVKQEAPERIYTHPTSTEYNVNPWPLEPSEYTEYVRADLLATVRREVNRAALLQAARDVCPYCGSRAVAFFAAVDGPNEARNFTHQHRTDRDARALCVASAIYSRLESSANSEPDDAVIGMFYNAELYGFDLLAAVERKHQFNLNRNYVAEGRQLHAPAPASPAALVLHCSCGAACTPDEYAAHRAMGHDAPVALGDEAVVSSLPNAPEVDPNRRCWASTTNEVCVSPRDCDDRGCQRYADEDYRSKYNQPTSKDIRAELIAAHSAMPRRHCAVHNREEFKYESLEHELRAATTSPSTLARKAAEELNKCGFLDCDLFVKVSYARMNEIAAIIERCFSPEGNK